MKMFIADMPPLTLFRGPPNPDGVKTRYTDVLYMKIKNDGVQLRSVIMDTPEGRRGECGEIFTWSNRECEIINPEALK